MKTGAITIAGIVIGGLIVFAIYQRKRKPPIYIRKKILKGYNARTLPPFGIYIIETEKNNQALIDHELIHWKQYQKAGLLAYYTQYIRELKKYGYDKMPMEQNARINETEYCRNNYTECVRKGQSNTIHNPNFRT